MKANYEEDKVIVSATEPTGVNRKKVWFKKGKNLFNKNNLIPNVNLLANGSIESDPLSSIHYIEVVGGQIYSLSSNVDRQWVFNTSAEKLSSSTQGSQRTVTSSTSVQINVPSGHKYINIRHYSNNEEDNIKQNIQLEQNPTVTAYEAYVEPEIYILNSNSVYERFYSENQFFYSAGENIYIPAGYIASGYITGGAKDIKFNIELNKNANKLNSINCTRLIANIRHVGGGYVVAGDTDFATYISSINVFNDKYVGIVLSNPNGWGITNNTPVLVQLSGQTIISTQ